MVYIMEWYVDGGCRWNGQPGSFAAAAAVEMLRGGRTHTWTRQLPREDYYNTRPTNQRAEIMAIIIALEGALDRYNNKLHSSPEIDLTVYSDSDYAVKCLTTWIYKWTSNGWINAKGTQVANRDLIEQASDLDDQLRELGDVTYKWIPRHENQLADTACNEELDSMADEYSSDGYSSSDY
jgi:ribonuclease HI